MTSAMAASQRERRNKEEPQGNKGYEWKGKEKSLIRLCTQVEVELISRFLYLMSVKCLACISRSVVDARHTRTLHGKRGEISPSRGRVDFSLLVVAAVFGAGTPAPRTPVGNASRRGCCGGCVAGGRKVWLAALGGMRGVRKYSGFIIAVRGLVVFLL